MPSTLEATLSPPLGQFFINMTMQIAGFVAAVAFGVFAIKSVQMADTSNRYAGQALNQSIIANKLAMLSVCLSAINAVSVD
jgi:CBS domain containing-hemolysin-like protein